MYKLFKNASIFFVSLLIFVFGWLTPGLLDWYYILAALVILVLLLDIAWLGSLSLLRTVFWSHSIGPVLFLISAVLFYPLLSSGWWNNLFWLLVATVIFFYLYNIWLFYGRPEKYQAFTLENYSWYLNLVTSFLASSSLFGFIVFVNLSLLLSLIYILVLSGLLFYQLWWVHKIDFDKFWLYLIFVWLLALEVFLALFYLPFSFYILAFWWTSVWYLSQQIILAVVKDSLVVKKTVRMVIFILLVNIILTATTRWF